MTASQKATLRELAEDLEAIVQAVSSRDGDATARQHARAEAVRACLAALDAAEQERDHERRMLDNLIQCVRRVGGAEYEAVIREHEGDCSVNTAIAEAVRVLRERAEQAEQERDTARETAQKHQRRAQALESGVRDNLEACRRAGVSLGRRLAAAGYELERQRAEQAEAKLAALTAPPAPCRVDDVAAPLFEAPCLWCGYSGIGYWQAGTHAKGCPWHQLGGHAERRFALADWIRSVMVPPAPPRKACPHGDPACPCQDGDPCHYEDTVDTKATAPPAPHAEAVRVLEEVRADIMGARRFVATVPMAAQGELAAFDACAEAIDAKLAALRAEGEGGQP